jgi:hypothetical protein
MVELYVGRGELAKVGEALSEAPRLRPNSPWVKMLEAYLAAARGDRTEALKLVALIGKSFPDWQGLAAYVWCGLHDLDGFFQKVEEALANHSLHLDKLWTVLSAPRPAWIRATTC